MEQRRMTQVDQTTGEVMKDGYVAVIFPKRKNGFQTGGWFAMAQGPIDALTNIKRVEDFRVLFALLKRLDYNNLIQVSQSDVARELEMDRSQVNRAIKRLIAMHAILPGPKVGISMSYRLNPSFGWKGSAKGHGEALRARMKAAGVRVI